MFTVSQLAKKFGLSRTTILYYEREGILNPTNRSDNGYRWYGDNEVKRLELIMAYRSFGLPIAQLATLLDRDNEATQENILLDQFDVLSKEIQALRLQQRAIVQFLNQPELLEEKVVTKERWVQIMRDAGLTEDDMINWHRQFEKREPQGHQEFLESLNIEAEEIAQIREKSRL